MGPKKKHAKICVVSQSDCVIIIDGNMHRRAFANSVVGCSRTRHEFHEPRSQIHMFSCEYLHLERFFHSTTSLFIIFFYSLAFFVWLSAIGCRNKGYRR